MRFYFAGAVKVGKTTLANSILDSFPRQWKFWDKSPPTYRAKKDNSRIMEEQRERTVGLDVHLKKVSTGNYFLIYDLGGQECFYTLHSLLLNCEESIFFVVFNVENKYEELEHEIRNQLKIIHSHHFTGNKPRVIFVGTHLDCIVATEEKNTEENVRKLIMVKILGDFHVETVCIKFVDARNSNSHEIIGLSKQMKDVADKMLMNMVSFYHDSFPLLIDYNSYYNSWL